jgi:hypothetical protein
MPNYVYNSISVDAKDQKQLMKFLENAKHESREFSFWNFVTPPTEALESGEYFTEHGWSKDGATGQTENNWYNFNNREWGTKWDAFDLHLEMLDQKGVLISFTTAWNCPTPVFEAMTEQYPELEFSFSWEEEQGWGGEAIGAGGHFSITQEWGIPESHADYVERDNLERCVCAHDDIWENWFVDCPTRGDVVSV